MLCYWLWTSNMLLSFQDIGNQWEEYTTLVDGVETMVNQVEQSLPTVEVEKVATHELASQLTDAKVCVDMFVCVCGGGGVVIWRMGWKPWWSRWNKVCLQWKWKKWPHMNWLPSWQMPRFVLICVCLGGGGEVIWRVGWKPWWIR